MPAQPVTKADNYLDFEITTICGSCAVIYTAMHNVPNCTSSNFSKGRHHVTLSETQPVCAGKTDQSNLLGK